MAVMADDPETSARRNMEELIVRLLTGRPDQTIPLVRESIEHARNVAWLSAARYADAIRLLDAGASIDAALKLLPEGAVWHMMTDYGDLQRAKVGPRENPSASIYNDNPNIFIEEDAATPALAFCVAALKSHAATDENNRDRDAPS